MHNNFKNVSLFHVSFLRKRVSVDGIFVHENYTATGSKANDIALLRLGHTLSSHLFSSNTKKPIMHIRLALTLLSNYCDWLLLFHPFSLS